MSPAIGHKDGSPNVSFLKNKTSEMHTCRKNAKAPPPRGLAEWAGAIAPAAGQNLKFTPPRTISVVNLMLSGRMAPPKVSLKID